MFPLTGYESFFSTYPCQICYLWYFWWYLFWHVWGDILWFWFAFVRWLMMLSIFSCAWWPSVCLLWKKYLFNSSAYFEIGPLKKYWVEWAICIFWILTPIGHNICKYFLPLSGVSFHFVNDFLCCEKGFKFNQVPIVYICFYFLCP